MKDAVIEVIGSVWFWRVLGAIVAAVWSLPRLKAWRDSVEYGKWNRLFEFAQVAANHTYQTYVQEAKRNSMDGKLSVEEIKEARKRAMAELRQLLRQEAPGLLDYYGIDVLSYAIERAVGLLKATSYTMMGHKGGKT